MKSVRQQKRRTPREGVAEQEPTPAPALVSSAAESRKWSPWARLGRMHPQLYADFVRTGSAEPWVGGGNTFRTGRMRTGLASPEEPSRRRSPSSQEPATMVLSPLQPSEGARCPGFGDGRAEGAFCIPGIFSAAGRHARDLPTPEIQRYGPLLFWIISNDIFLLAGGGVGSIISCDIVSGHPAPSHCPSSLPVTLPGVPDIVIIDLMLISLLIQEVKHVFDGEGQGAPTMCCAEDGLKQVIHKFLQGALKRREKSRSATPGASKEMNQVIPLPTSLIS